MYTLAIRQLPQHLANKIAAGEVVERPASVVKELVENSIDANSTEIDISLQEAGLLEIIVKDNGDGISEADCKKAFLRHATSKIKYDADLFHIESLGFRGEALASIASVSKLTMETSTGETAGTSIYLEGGNIVEESKTTARKGTEITVRELFFNTPARLKYMKSLHTELGHITDLVNRYALAESHIRFSLTHNGKTIFKSPGTNNVLQVISQIYGMEVARNMVAVETESLDFSVSGFIGKPEITRANRNFMTCIVNGRYIKSQPLNYAILRAYDTLLPIHRFPIVVLHITLDPILIDVNVHPTKLEVRFSKEKELVQLIEQMIKDTFKQMTLIPQVAQKVRKEKIQISQDTFDFTKDIPADKIGPIESVKPEAPGFPPDMAQVKEAFVAPSNEAKPFDVPPVHPIQSFDEGPAQGVERIPMLYPIGQLQGTYILAQNEHGLYMIDQHAAQERIKYEFYKEKLGTPERALQQLLMPLTFDFTTNEIMFIQENEEKLQEVGIFLEHFGGQTYAVRSHPKWFPEGQAEEMIRDIIDQVIKTGNISIQAIREEVAILMSCKKSIKANHYLTDAEMTRLLADLTKTNDPFTCPHGRPVIIHYTYYEIEKMFKRIM